MPHAQDPAGTAGRTLRLQPYLPFRHAGRDRHDEDSQRLQRLPHRQGHEMGAKCDPRLERQIAMAHEPVTHAGSQHLFAGLLISLMAWPQSVWAYRPFDSTDAAVADKGVWEFEFSPLSYEHGDS